MNGSSSAPEVQYVKTPDGAHIAYQVFGSGPFDIVFVPGFVWNVERQWWLEPVARGLRRIGSFARVVVFDRRGTGLSDRIDEANPPTLEARMDDIRAVMDEVGIERAALIGDEDGATLCAMFAASYPARVLAAVFHASAARGAWAPDMPWSWTPDEWDEYLRHIEAVWGTQAGADYFIERAWPSQARDPKLRREFASFMRLSSSPGAAVYFESVYRDTDIRNILGTIQVPVLETHRTGDLIEPVESSRHLAANIATARLETKPRPRDEILDGGRHEHLLRACARGDASADVDGDAADVRSVQLDLARVDPCANLRTQGVHRVLDGERAAHGACRTVEDREEAVSGVVDLAPAVPPEQRTHTLIVGGDEFPPGTIPDPRDSLGRTDEIGEEHRGEDAIDVHLLVLH